jgi:two-component sensor histidine kinase
MVETGQAATSRLSLRILLLLIFAVALSPVLILGGVRWSNDIQRESERRQEVMLLVAGGAADRAENVLATAPALLDVINAVGLERTCSSDFAKLIDNLPQFSNMVTVDADGRITCSAVEGRVNSTVAERDWFKELRDTGAPYVQSAAVRSPATQDWTLAAAKRLTTPDGKFDGALAIGVPISSLVYRLDRTGLPKDSEISLVDDTGRVFASNYWTMLGADIVAKLPSVGEGQSGFFTTKTVKDGERQIALVRLSPGRLYAMLSAPALPAIALENVNAFGNFALPLLSWLLALATVWMATDWLVLRWLDYLRRIAGLYASGKMSVQPLRARRQAPAEVTVLADSMQDMAEKIRDRTDRLELAVEARDAAMKEIHHRVKNNLQIINSLLSLQSRKVHDPAALAVLDDARTRINALSLIHRSLYENNDIRSVDVKSFFGELVAHLDQALGAEDQQVRIESDIDADTIDADAAVPLALFTAEAVTNAIKHAFPGLRGGRVIVSYKVQPTGPVLTIEDDGVGGETPEHQGLGSALMTAFARQVRGQMEEGRTAGGGRLARIRMPGRAQSTNAGAK